MLVRYMTQDLMANGELCVIFEQLPHLIIAAIGTGFTANSIGIVPVHTTIVEDCASIIPTIA